MLISFPMEYSLSRFIFQHQSPEKNVDTTSQPLEQTQEQKIQKIVDTIIQLHQESFTQNKNIIQKILDEELEPLLETLESNSEIHKAVQDLKNLSYNVEILLQEKNKTITIDVLDPEKTGVVYQYLSDDHTRFIPDEGLLLNGEIIQRADVIKTDFQKMKVSDLTPQSIQDAITEALSTQSLDGTMPSSEEIRFLLHAIHTGEANIQTLQSILKKIDTRLNNTLDQNQGIDGKYGYATSEAVQKLSLTLSKFLSREINVAPNTFEIEKQKEIQEKAEKRSQYNHIFYIIDASASNQKNIKIGLDIIKRSKLLNKNSKIEIHSFENIYSKDKNKENIAQECLRFIQKIKEHIEDKKIDGKEPVLLILQTDTDMDSPLQGFDINTINEINTLIKDTNIIIEFERRTTSGHYHSTTSFQELYTSYKEQKELVTSLIRIDEIEQEFKKRFKKSMIEKFGTSTVYNYSIQNFDKEYKESNRREGSEGDIVNIYYNSFRAYNNFTNFIQKEINNLNRSEFVVTHESKKYQALLNEYKKLQEAIIKQYENPYAGEVNARKEIGFTMTTKTEFDTNNRNKRNKRKQYFNFYPQFTQFKKSTQ